MKKTKRKPAAGRASKPRTSASRHPYQNHLDRIRSVVDPEMGSKKFEMQETPSEERQEVAKADDKA